MKDAINESLDIPESGKYKITVAKRKTPWGDTELMTSKVLPDGLDFQSIEKEISLDVAESVEVQINVDDESFEVQD